MADAEWSPSPAVEYLEDGYDARDRFMAGWYDAPANALGDTQAIYRRDFYQVESVINDACDDGRCFCGATPGFYGAMPPPTDAELDAWVQNPRAIASAFWGPIEAHIAKHHTPSRQTLPNNLL